MMKYISAGMRFRQLIDEFNKAESKLMIDFKKTFEDLRNEKDFPKFDLCCYIKNLMPRDTAQSLINLVENGKSKDWEY